MSSMEPIVGIQYIYIFQLGGLANLFKEETRLSLSSQSLASRPEITYWYLSVNMLPS